MAVTRARKIEQVEKLGKDLQNVSTVIVTTYTKLTVPQDYELRKAAAQFRREIRRGEEHSGGTRGQGHQS